MIMITYIRTNVVLINNNQDGITMLVLSNTVLTGNNWPGGNE